MKMTAELNLKRYATYASVTVALILIASKIAAYWHTDSVSILSSLLDSTIDVTASIMILFGVRTAQKPADADHRYGHGKAETIAALGQAAFLAGSALFLMIESVKRIWTPMEIKNEWAGVAAMAFSCLVTIGLLIFQNHVIRKTNSLAIKADSMNYIGDVGLNITVIIALMLNRFLSFPYADGIFGLFIGLYLAFQGYRIGHQAADILLDKELPNEDRQKILTLIQNHALTRGVHDLRTRSTGTHIFIEFHLELDAHMSLQAAHNIADMIEESLKTVYPNADILIHQEPAGLHDDRLDNRLAIA